MTFNKNNYRDNEGPSLKTSIFPLSFQVVRELLPFAYHSKHLELLPLHTGKFVVRR